ncbi:hypothetical protein ABOM_001133 [Aspergillus bombycis]|uniref:Glycosyltransferase 2-like domain-containing protein n=1 Tax=Aspergillus bombycis TaxID=109264 RepID=A0A1F8AF94_9EURO|nr:hypothetical protein ABOM_001133 [Aspergillus bombycis]OGM50352.1 hypothetical protein ABOM_001133 [Aspergillus bombycis]
MAWKKRTRPKLRLTGDKFPSVDVFVTCCGEDDAVVLDMVRGALDRDYPLDKFRVIILDDSRSASMASAIGELATMYPNIFYMVQEKIPGNLKNGLDQVQYLPGGASELMATLDADMIPEWEWLRACIPHILLDPKSLDFFVNIIEPIKDALGVAWCTGSGYVVRRQALEDSDNFPLGTRVEDVATSTLMLGKGWKTVYIHEPYSFGIVGTAAKLNFCLWDESVRHLTFAQRFSGFIYAIINLSTLLLTASLFAIPIILLWGKHLVAYANEDQLRWLMWACFLWMSPYIAVCMVRSFILPKWLGGQTQAFNPTGSLAAALNERDPKLTKNMFIRLRAVFLNYMVFFHLAFVSMWTPITYAIDPPIMPDREESPVRDQKTSVAHPTEESKRIAFGGQAVWFEFEYSAAITVVLVVFIR